MAVGLKGTHCGRDDSQVASELLSGFLNGGCKGNGDKRTCGVLADNEAQARSMLMGKLVEARFG